MTESGYRTDVILIGAGIMSAHLGTLFKLLAPDWEITVFEKLDQPGEESSNEWNNAGTGHAALCELNYTVERADGTIDIQKAINVNQQFHVSRQFWSYLVQEKIIENPRDFIRPLPHMSLVHGAENVNFLKKRYETLIETPLFKDMEFSDDPDVIKQWIPLVMEGRTGNEPIAATKVDSGTDVNFGALTRKLFAFLEKNGVDVRYKHIVKDIKRTGDGRWQLLVKNLVTGEVARHTANFVFIGAGGGALHLLQKSGIPEGKRIGGFPVSGLFMVCKNPDVVNKHHAKVYGKAKVGAPPMSVPHLDTRFIDNQKTLLFGPFAGFSPRFLKTGSMFDLLTSVKPHNILTMLAAGFKNMNLVTYLIQQVLLTKEQRMKELREFVPTARSEDWDLIVAGQRVQVIKDTEKGGKGTIQFGTEVVASQDGSIAALLGASPGASTVVHVMLEVLRRCFPQNMLEWEDKIKEMIPSYGVSLMDHPELLEQVQQTTAETLKLTESETVETELAHS